MIEYEGQCKKTEYKKREVKSHHKNGKTKYFIDDIFTFDIETTSAWIDENGDIVPYTAGINSDIWNNRTPLALCYLWQFGINDSVYYGRELSDFRKVLEDLPKDYNIIIWVHNLSFEFHWLLNIFNGVDVFARSAHKVMKFRPLEFHNIEFRCSYFLTRLSLDVWGKTLGVNKLAAIDYEKIRTPKTPLDDEIMKYGERDCIVVFYGIKEKLKEYMTPDKIPLTQTGIVRREVKNRLCVRPSYVAKLKTLVPRNAEEYHILQEVFAGGYTHANRIHAGQTIKGYMEHYDFVSSYPKEMVGQKYPYTPWIYTGKKYVPNESTFDNMAYIMKIRFRKIQCQTFNTFLQCYKCYTQNLTADNGRVLYADLLETYMTEQDWLTVKLCYTWKEIEVLEVYSSQKEYLPKDFVEYILQLYEYKTTLKGVTDNERAGAPSLYNESKQRINAMFGMTVTAIIQAEVALIDDKWKMGWYDKKTKKFVEGTIPASIVTEKLQNLANGWKRDKRYFLNYSWGIWVTSYAKRDLWTCLLGKEIAPYEYENDYNTIYADTDSLFLLGKQDFSWYNEKVVAQLDTACKHHGIDPERTRPKDPHGIKRQLGFFLKEEEKGLSEFRTQGAKRYAMRDAETGKLSITVSGINKEAVSVLNDNIDNFTEGLNFDKDAAGVKKMLPTYCNDLPEITWPDGYKSKYKYGINMRRNGYKMTMDGDYSNLLQYEEIYGFTDEWNAYRRGVFTL